jgi:hypothetical protein
VVASDVNPSAGAALLIVEPSGAVIDALGGSGRRSSSHFSLER